MMGHVDQVFSVRNHLVLQLHLEAALPMVLGLHALKSISLFVGVMEKTIQTVALQPLLEKTSDIWEDVTTQHALTTLTAEAHLTARKHIVPQKMEHVNQGHHIVLVCQEELCVAVTTETIGIPALLPDLVSM